MCGGQYPGPTSLSLGKLAELRRVSGPMSSDSVGAGYRIWKMEDRGRISDLYPIFYLLSSAAEAALADGVREVGSLPSFAVGPKGHRFERQARFFSSLRKSEGAN